MTLTYQESSDLMNDAAFKGRVKIACLHFATYIVGEGPAVPAHTTRVRWAQGVFVSPEAAANQVTPVVVMDAAVQQDGAAITDTALQSAVENSINKMI